MKIKKNKKQIVLVGAKHVGKSSVGKELAPLLSLPFIDSDDVICSLACAESNISKTSSARDVYKLLGEKKFRDLEKQAITSLPLECVFASGGGLSQHKDAWSILKTSYVIFLECSVNTAWSRIIEEGIPAFLEDSPVPFDAFREIFINRNALYKTHADIVFNVEDEPPKETAVKIATILQQ